jgi:hypothetical protein
MAIIATDVSRYGNLVKREFWPEKGWGKEVATTAIPFGTVVKFTGAAVAVLTAPPIAGDKIGVVLLATEEDATKKLVMTKGPSVLAKSQLITFAGVTAPQLVTIYAALEAVNMQVNDQA